MPRGRRLDGKLEAVEGGQGKVLSHDETLLILSDMARKGSVSAATALERALRRQAKQEASFDDELDELLG